MRQVLSRQVLGKGVLTAAAASSLLSIATGAAYAHPGAMAEASHSPGVLSGNSVSVPITFSPNVCGNSVDGGAALNPAMGNTCVTSTGSDAGHHDYERYLSPENAEAFRHYLEEREGGRHALPAQREDEGGYGERGDEAPRAHAPRHAAPRPEEARPEAPRPEAPKHAAPRPQAPRQEAPRHAAPRHDDSRHEDAYGGSGEEDHGPRGGKEECDDHPPAPHAQPPAPHPAPPAPAPHHPQPKPQPKPAPAPRPAPAPAVAAGSVPTRDQGVFV
ncbi:chaplin family protein, partial [Streptomyces sp. NPDC058157]|uniref:chaplin n=1 Tax=Streptomyces sp. NPDC058157 TaxID=3346360 RepID=UPI0036F128BC